VTGTTTENAGNTATATAGGIKIDKASPRIQITLPCDGARYSCFFRGGRDPFSHAKDDKGGEERPPMSVWKTDRTARHWRIQATIGVPESPKPGTQLMGA
jgi:hypothetical protein